MKTVFWRCIAEPLCRARLTTGIDYNVSLTGTLKGEHCHIPVPVKVETRKVASKIKAQAASSLDAPRAIISEYFVSYVSYIYVKKL